ncbi:MAG TPA: hypothetical protein VFJ58_14055 [Armatimonadota bacterium]|nr:hypothetical protein [Armatimonadota bacterium]
MVDLPHAFPTLLRKQQKGSKPRCHLFTSGLRSEVAGRLTALIEPWGQVLQSDSWMPDGFKQIDEAQLHTAEQLIPDTQTRNLLSMWWLAAPAGTSRTPCLDIASTCLIDGKRGLLLVEAKAHDAELRNEERGKPLGGEDNKGVSIDSRRNHVRIGACIQEASLALSSETRLVWSLSRDWNYQMANRFSWAWKLAELRIPVILVYLGYIGCEEMRKGASRRPIKSKQEWDELVMAHSQPLFPREVWNQKWNVHEQSFIPLIRAYDQSLDIVETI